MANRKGGFIGQDGLNAPDEPTGVSASAGDESASVSFTAPSDVGGSAVTGYVATSNDGIGATGSSSPITVTGLTNGTAYTFRVWALNAFGYSAPSGVSGSVTPSNPVALFGGDSNVIEQITIGTTGNSTDFGDLTVSHANGPSAFSSATRAIWAGGDNQNVIDFVTFATAGNATDFGDLSKSKYDSTGCSNSTRGIVAGGEAQDGTAEQNVIEFVTMASAGNAANFGDLIADARGMGGCASPTRGVFAGYYNGTIYNTIQYITIASTGNATDFGDLIEDGGTRYEFPGCSNDTRGIFAGGFTGGNSVNIINYITIASTGNATDFGDLQSGYRPYSHAAASSSTRGVFAGGSDIFNGGIKHNVISYVTIATTGNSSNFGDLLTTRDRFAGCSSAHGGLS